MPGRRSRINIGQEFVIGGYIPGSNGIDALVVGFYSGRSLLYAARVRAGLVPAIRRDVSPAAVARRAGLPVLESPRSKKRSLGTGADRTENEGMYIWVKPKLVANFHFLEWTDSNHVRHIKFASLREKIGNQVE